MKRLLVTGGAGFIGSHFIEYLLDRYPDYHLVNLDLLTYAADRVFAKKYEEHPRCRLVQGDICDQSLLSTLFDRYSFEAVIHFAAESHVDNSIKDPSRFIKTNVVGTQCLLQEAMTRWMESPHNPRSGCGQNRFHHISTDEVYGSAGAQRSFIENDPFRPSSPYSASKAASDLLVHSYGVTYGINSVITNCSNNYGPRQHQEKLIPTIIRKAIGNESIPIYGNGSNIRDWLYVRDHCRALDSVFHRGIAGHRYNIGGREERQNTEVAKKICYLLDRLQPRQDGKSYTDQISFIADRPGHDLRYSIDCGRIESELDWKPEYDFDRGLYETVCWYVDQLALKTDDNLVLV